MKTANILHHVRCAGGDGEYCMNDAVVTIPQMGAVRGYCEYHLYCVHNDSFVKLHPSGLTQAEITAILSLSRSTDTRSASTQNVH